MSSEESGSEADDIFVRPLSWRSDLVNKFFRIGWQEHWKEDSSSFKATQETYGLCQCIYTHRSWWITKMGSESLTVHRSKNFVKHSRLNRCLSQVCITFCESLIIPINIIDSRHFWKSLCILVHWNLSIDCRLSSIRMTPIMLWLIIILMCFIILF